MRQRLNTLLHLVVHIGEGELGSLAMHGLGNAPRDGTIGGHAHDKGALAGKKSHVQPSRHRSRVRKRAVNKP